jgi:predicted enzyme related to lactoylglutathione lyase
MTIHPQAGAVMYAKDVERIAQFYAALAGLTRATTAADHVVFGSSSFQLVVHRIPEFLAASITITNPPLRRERTPIKLVLWVERIAPRRTMALALGGALDPVDTEWAFDGCRVCDGVDPEGNVFQLRAPQTD